MQENSVRITHFSKEQATGTVTNLNAISCSCSAPLHLIWQFVLYNVPLYIKWLQNETTNPFYHSLTQFFGENWGEPNGIYFSVKSWMHKVELFLLQHLHKNWGDPNGTSLWRHVDKNWGDPNWIYLCQYFGEGLVTNSKLNSHLKCGCLLCPGGLIRLNLNIAFLGKWRKFISIMACPHLQKLSWSLNLIS